MRKIPVSLCFIIFIIFLLKVFSWGEVRLTILKCEAVNEKKARLFVMIFDEAGIPIKGLTKENFRLKVGGEEIVDFKIESVSATESPLSIVLGVDVSGSMKGKPFAETKRAISRFLDQLDKRDYISLMTFGSRVVFLTDFTSKKYIIREKMQESVPIEKWTHLYDATCEALKKVQRRAPTTKKAIILITDGKDEKSTKSRAESVDKALNTNVPIFAIGFGHKIDREYLEEIVKVSEGYFLFTPNPDEITKLYDKVLDILKNEYAIRFDFLKSPGRYMANLVLNYQDRAAEVYREFLFNPPGVPVIISETYKTDQKEKPARESWIKKITVEWLIVIALAILFLIIIFAILWIRSRDKLSERRFKKLTEEIAIKSPSACELEFPEDYHTTHAGFIESWSNIKDEDDETKFSEIPTIFLEVDCYHGRIIPLVYRGIDMLEELIIARRSGEKKEKDYMKKGSAYLLVSEGKQVISRPKKDRDGHARIFLTEGENYAVEDLGSKIGTFVNNKPIRGIGPAVLQDGDLIEIGGKSGIRIIYKETELNSVDMEGDYSEKTTIKGD